MSRYEDNHDHSHSVRSITRGRRTDGDTLSGKTAANDLRAVLTDKQFAELAQTMTAGDELTLSTQLAQCQERYATQLTPSQLDVTRRLGYKFDADVINRMFSFMERHHIADAFNDEEESRKGRR